MDLFSNNYNYDIIIVGGGISGLFTAYKLSKTNLKILLLEMHENLVVGFTQFTRQIFIMNVLLLDFIENIQNYYL